MKFFISDKVKIKKTGQIARILMCNVTSDYYRVSYPSKTGITTEDLKEEELQHYNDKS